MADFGWNPDFLKRVKQFEGPWDSPAKWDAKQFSMGHGTAWRPGMPSSFPTQAAADAAYMGDMNKAMAAVQQRFPSLDPNSRQALASLTYNAGGAWMKDSELARAIDKGDMRGAAEVFKQYTKSGGKDMAQLSERRAYEAQFLGGTKAPGGAPSWTPSVTYGEGTPAGAAPSAQPPDGMDANTMASSPAAAAPITAGVNPSAPVAPAAPRTPGSMDDYSKLDVAGKRQQALAKMLMEGGLSDKPKSALEGIGNLAMVMSGGHQASKADATELEKRKALSDALYGGEKPSAAQSFATASGDSGAVMKSLEPRIMAPGSIAYDSNWKPVAKGGVVEDSLQKDYRQYREEALAAGQTPQPLKEFDLDRRRAGATQAGVTMQGESEESKLLGKERAENKTRIRQGAEKAYDELTTVATMERAMADPRFASGALAEHLILPIKNAIATFGGDKDAAASMEVFRAQSNKSVMQDLGGSLGANISNSDRDFVRGIAPQLSTSDAGNKWLVEIKKRGAQRKIEGADFMDAYESIHGKVDEKFYAAFRKWKQENPLFSKEEQAQMIEDAKAKAQPAKPGAGSSFSRPLAPLDTSDPNLSGKPSSHPEGTVINTPAGRYISKGGKWQTQ